jgi:glycerophosphoryl diester phosphodiesterase
MTRPIVIAHRGASGYLPEHTLAAKALAYGLGADFLEQDVVATRDSELVVLHDIYLDDITDVARHFPGRQRPDGHYYVVDFDLAELRGLNVVERRKPGTAAAMYPDRFPSGMRGLRVVTLDEELQLIQGLNRSMRRDIGIYPEIKDPAWHRAHGLDLAQLLLRKLDDYGYRTPDDAVFVQCFDAAELRRVRHDLKCALRLVQLVGNDARHAELLTPEGLDGIATYAAGLGPHYSQLVDSRDGASNPGTAEVRPVTAWAHAAGLQLHPYTFRRDALPEYVPDLEALLTLFLRDVGVDGVFCDHPDIGVRVRNTLCDERRAT